MRRIAFALATIALLAGPAIAGQSVTEKAGRSAEHAQNMINKKDATLDHKTAKLAHLTAKDKHDGKQARLGAEIARLAGKIAEVLGLCGSCSVP